MKKIMALAMAILLFGAPLSGCLAWDGVTAELTGEDIHAIISPSTVEVYAENDQFAAIGTGFFIDDSGTVVTNHHVIEDCSRACITTSDGYSYEVTHVLGYSAELDIAVLATTKTGSKAVTLCDTASTGEKVFVLGSSKGLTGTFSEGLVSTARRYLNDSVYIQISAPISSGNSGGPVVNAKGQVIGIACAVLAEGQNLNFAIPIGELAQISTDQPLTMAEFYETTYIRARLMDRIQRPGSTLAIRTATVGDALTADLIVSAWQVGDQTEAYLITVLDEYCYDQGGGQLYVIDQGAMPAEVDAWFFDPARVPGDYALIENAFGYTICYYSYVNLTEF